MYDTFCEEKRDILCEFSLPVHGHFDFFFIMYIYLQTITMQTGRQCHQVTAVNYNFFFFTGTLVCCPLLKLKVISLIQNCRYFPAKDQRISTAWYQSPTLIKTIQPLQIWISIMLTLINKPATRVHAMSNIAYYS